MTMLEFLSLVKENNNRDWFNKNKHLYFEAREQFLELVEDIYKGLVIIDNSIDIQESKKAVYRFYRDVRFSKNKLPYKLDFGAFFAPGGRRAGKAGYYLRIEPGNCMVGGGLHCPKGDALKEVRFEIYNHVGEFGQIIDNPEFKSSFGDLAGEKLKRPPKGFPKDFPQIEWLKRKEFITVQAFPDKLVDSKDLVPFVLESFKRMKPLNDFLNRVLTDI